MFLYDKKESSLDIYKFSGKQEALRDYRVEQMRQIPAINQVVVAKTIIPEHEDTPLFEKPHIESQIIPMESANSIHGDCYHLLDGGITSPKSKEALLNTYYQGQLSHCKVVTIQDENQLRYFLLRLANYITAHHNDRKRIMKDIIELPEALYLLQLLEQEKFHLIGDRNVKEQLDLFSIEQVGEVSLDELPKMITQSAYTKTIEKANRDAKILSLLKNDF